MPEPTSKIELLNDFLIFLIAIIGLVVFCLSSIQATGLVITANGLILFVLVVVILLFRHF
jgi:hypothetical protein